jgi:Tfp pilus assembly protein PilF
MNQVGLRGAARLSWGAIGAVLLGAVTACGGAQEPPKTADDSPENILADEPQGAAPASNAEVQKGIDLLSNQDFAGAKAILQKAVEQDSKDSQALFYLGVAESGLGETDAAIGHLQQALQLDPKLVEAALNLSALLLDKERFDEALSVADQGLASAPNDTGLIQNKAMALLLSGKEADAAPLLAQIVEKKADDDGLRFMYAQALVAAGDETRAKEQLGKLAASKDREVLASAADLLGRLKSWDDCAKALTGAIAIEPASELYVKRGLCLHGKDDEAGAKADFDKAIELDPKSAKAHFYLGHNLRAKGDKKGAKAAFKKVVELEPSGQMSDAAKAAIAKL